MIARPPERGAAARYLADGAGTVSQERLLVMLCERLQRDVQRAANALGAGERETAHTALMHAQDIVTELDLALDHDVWDGAAAMSEIYRHLMQRLIAANIGRDRSAVQDCLRIVDELSSMWSDALSALAAEATVAQRPVDGFAPDTSAAPTDARSAPTLDVVG